jgi:hypothetical protein
LECTRFINSYFAIFHISNLETQITLRLCYNEIGNFRRNKTWRVLVTIATNASGDRGNNGSKSSHRKMCNVGKKVALVTGTSKFILVAMVIRQLKQSYKPGQAW